MRTPSKVRRAGGGNHLSLWMHLHVSGYADYVDQPEALSGA
jgi:hypothetical protein